MNTKEIACNNSLFDLNNEFLRSAQYLEECKIEGVEPEPDMVEMYNGYCSALMQKIDNCYSYDSFVNSQIDRFKKEKELISKKLEILDNMQTRFRDYLMSIAIQNNNELKGEIHKVKVSSRPSVLITDEEIIPLEYIVIKTEKRINKQAILSDLKKNVLVDGAVIQHNEFMSWK